MKFLENDRVMCLSPHPDDVEYSMSGTILKFKDTIFDIFILTSGGDTDKTKRIIRFEEVFKFWDDIENINLVFVNGLQPKEFSEDIAIDIIENNFDLTIYDSIFIPCRDDTHFYHRKVSNLGRSLCRVDKFNLYEYFTPSAEPTWVPNLIVDVSKQYDDKKDRIKNFQSQIHRTYFSEFCLNAFHSDLHYNKKGLNWIEKFKVINQNL